MPEIQAIADRVTVLKDGRTVMTTTIAEAPTTRLVRAMVGRDLADFYPPRAAKPFGPPALTIRSASNQRLANIDLVVRSGEIVGVAGLEGSGKTELGRAIAGDEPFESGTMEIAGKMVAPRHPRAAIAAGVGRLSEDRKREALLMQQSLRDNATLLQRAFAPSLGPPTAAPMAVNETDERLRRLDVRAASFEQEARQLSGGNQQKVIIARWLARNPEVLVFAEPTRGIDVGAKAAIYKIMRDLADRGRGILMISSDLPEIVGVSDRIVVMREGRVAGELPGRRRRGGDYGDRRRPRGRRGSDASMSRAEALASPPQRRGVTAPIILLVGSVALYVGVALATGQSMMLHLDGIVGLLQRMVGLGLVAVGQTFAILAGSIDLSVANLISVAAVLASFIMQGRPEMMLPAVAAVLAISAIVGVINGALISRLQVNPLIATLGVGLFLQGILQRASPISQGPCPRNSRRSPMERSASRLSR